MTKLRNMVGAFVIFFAVIVLVAGFWGDWQTNYDIEETNLDNLNQSISAEIQKINIIGGIERLTIGITNTLKPQSAFDLLGGIALVATGTLQTIGGIVTFIPEIFGVVTKFYPNVIPPVVTQIIGFLVVIAVGFILLSAKLGFEL
jgi:hypothetical protein